MNQHEPQSEKDIIGSMLLYPHTVAEVSLRLKPKYLYLPATRAIYTIILKMYQERIAIDVVSVCRELNKSGQLDMVGGAHALSLMTRNGDIRETHQLQDCLTIHEKYILRELHVLAQTVINLSETKNADCFEIVELMNRRTSELMDIRSQQVKAIGDHFNDLITDINQVIDHGAPTGLMCGIKNIDDRTGGFQGGNSIVVAARPGMGKTAFVVQVAKNVAVDYKKPVLIFSLEMTAKELTARAAASEGFMSSTKIAQKKINRIELQQLTGRCSKLIDAPIYIDDTPNWKIDDLIAQSRRLFYQNKIELIIIDYLQLMDGSKKGNREGEISEISRKLKVLAKELGIPIIPLSQLSRECEKRPDKRPQLSDLRESGAIEQDADIIMFLYRPEYYGLYEEGYPYNGASVSTKNLMIYEIAKGRGIETGEGLLKFYGHFMQVLNYNSQQTVLNTNENFLNDAQTDII